MSEIKTDKRLEIMYLKAKYESEGLNISHIDWNLAIEYEKHHKSADENGH